MPEWHPAVFRSHPMYSQREVVVAESRDHLFLIDGKQTARCRVPQRLPSVPETQNKKASPEELAYLLDPTGAAGRNRTGDLRITNALLYQLSYSGEKERAC
jgi:hypothetical protein